jgi:hypothetical protein
MFTISSQDVTEDIPEKVLRDLALDGNIIEMPNID